MSKDIHELLRESCLRAGIPIVGCDKAARIMSILYVHGNSEKLVYNAKFRADVKYCQRRYGIQGGERPDEDFLRAYQKYVKVLEAYEATHKGETSRIGGAMPEWAEALLQEYGI